VGLADRDAHDAAEPPRSTSPALDWRASLPTRSTTAPELAQRRIDIDEAEVEMQRARSQRLPALDLDLATSSGGFDVRPAGGVGQVHRLGVPASSGRADLQHAAVEPHRAQRRPCRARARCASVAGCTTRFELDVLDEVRTGVNEVEKQRETVVAAIKSRTLAQRQLEAGGRRVGMS
jgi:hypothetical protein